MKQDTQNIFRRYLADIIVVLSFAAISFAYFFPAVTEGRILYRHDSSAGRGAGQEISVLPLRYRHQGKSR